VSKERQRARAARQETRRREVEAAAAARARRDRQAGLRQRLRPSLPKRRRRYDSLTARQWAQLVLSFFVTQVLGWMLLPGLAQRAALVVLTLACLLVIVRTRRSPSR